MRKDPKKLGRVTELLALDKDFKAKRKAFEVEDGVVAREGKRGKGEQGGEGPVKAERAEK